MSSRLASSPWRLPIALVGVCAVLAAVLGAELSRSWLTDVPPPEQVSPPSQKRPSLPEVSFLAKPPEVFAEINERPLFARSRRPPPRTEGPPTAATGEMAGSLQLAGTMVTQGRRAALVLPEGAVRPIMVEVGHSVGGWTVEAIDATRVRFRSGTKVEEIVLKDRGTPPAAAAPRPGPSKPTKKQQRPSNARPQQPPPQPATEPDQPEE